MPVTIIRLFRGKAFQPGFEVFLQARGQGDAGEPERQIRFAEVAYGVYVEEGARAFLENNLKFLKEAVVLRRIIIYGNPPYGSLYLFNNFSKEGITFMKKILYKISSCFNSNPARDYFYDSVSMHHHVKGLTPIFPALIMILLFFSCVMPAFASSINANSNNVPIDDTGNNTHLSLTTPCDVNGDSVTDILDLIWIASKIGPAGTGDAAKADLNSDGQVNILDLLEAELYIAPQEPGITGSVTFTVLQENKSSMTFDPNSESEQSISLTSPDGLKWTLTIPAHALLDETGISMTLLNDVQSESLGSLKTGVQFEPDGLQFLKPALLTLEGGGLGEHPLILSGNHIGSELGFALAETSVTGASAHILHFSNAYADPFSDAKKLQTIKAAAEKDYQFMKKQAQDCLNTPIEVPAPPAYSLRCLEDPTSQDQALNAFLQNNPESELIKQLIACSKSLELLGEDNYLNEALGLEQNLLARLDSKVELLINSYYPQEDYFWPIFQADLEVHKARQLLGVEGSYTNTKMGAWAKIIAKLFLDDLKQKHDYTLMEQIGKLSLEATLLGLDMDSFIAEMIKAAHFELQFEQTFILSESLEFKMSGTAQISLNKGQGQGQYDSFREIKHNDDETMDLPNPFEFTSLIKMHPCKEKTVDVLLDHFGAESETIHTPYGDYQEICDLFIAAAFEDKKTTEEVNGEKKEFRRFTLPLHNLQVTAAEGTFNGVWNENSTESLTLRLIHKPE